MKNQIIILGGMGPQASLHLHAALLTLSREYHDGSPDSYPAILHVSMQVPDFIGSKKLYAKALKLLQDTCHELSLDTSSAVGIACNTAHLMVDDLPLEKAPFVSMVEAVVEKAIAMGVKKVGLLASPNTIASGLYVNAFKGKSIEVIDPSQSDIKSLDLVIHRVIDGEDPSILRVNLNRVAQHLCRKGADTILLGCTELPLIGLDNRFPVIDSLQVLAEAMLKQHYKKLSKQ